MPVASVQSLKSLLSDQPIQSDVSAGVAAGISLPSAERTLLDGTGVLASILCVIHCVGIPLILSFFPSMSFGFFQSEHFHLVAAIIAGAIAFHAFGKGFRRHGSYPVLALGGIGASLLFIAVLNPAGWVTPRLESVITVIGSILLITGHFRNYQLSPHAHSHSHSHSHSHVHSHSH